MRFLTFFIVIYFGDVSAENLDPRAVLVQNFLNSNKETVKGAGNDKILSAAIVNTLGLNTSNAGGLSDASSNNLVLMDATVACDSGWKQWSGNGMCYKISSTDTTWYAAEDWCYSQRSGSHLTSIHSQAEAQWIAATYVSGGWLPYMDNWVGLRRSCDNTTYVWTDGTPVDYLWWQPGYPGSKDPEKSCVTIWVTTLLKLNSAYTPGMFDNIWDCGTNTATPTCKYDPTSTAPHIKYDTSYTCAETTTVSTTTTTATTTTPTTTTTTPTTTTTTPTTTITTPTTTTTTPTTTTVTTTTETTTTPSTTTTTPTATTTTSTTTTTTPTTTTKATTTAAPSGPVDCSPKCDPFWISYNGGCYGIVQGTSDFSTAELGCQSFGGEMAVITDAAMNEAMRFAFSTNNDSTVAHQAWVGASSYSNWAPGKPNKAQGTQYAEYCNVFALSVVNNGLDFGFSRGVWTDYPCSLTQEFVLCKQS